MITRLHIIVLVFILFVFAHALAPPVLLSTNETIAQEQSRTSLSENETVVFLAQALIGMSDKVVTQSGVPGDGGSSMPSSTGLIHNGRTTEYDTVGALVATLQRLAVIAENQEKEVGQGGAFTTMEEGLSDSRRVSRPALEKPLVSIVDHLKELERLKEEINQLYQTHFPNSQNQIENRHNTYPFIKDGHVFIADLLFDKNSTALTPGAIRRLEKSTNWLKLLPDIEKIIVIGHADRTGSQIYNENLARVRTNETVGFLRRSGLTDANYNALVYGERQLIVQTGDNISEPLNRIVSIWASLSGDT